ncbi:ABC transporter ATP-binding protein [bacterium]|nr:ABC transporter ATP-binding protein [bacterium]
MTQDIQIKSVTKVFETGIRSRKTAVDNLTLDIPRGEVVGLLGANGSGKSTTLKMILGFLRPTSGNILIAGVTAGTRASRTHLGYLPENPRFQRFLRGRSILEYIGRLHRMSGAGLSRRCTELLELVGLEHAGGERVQGYSKGMIQRLAIAQALINRPKILIFDEPMSGLDPLGRMEIRNLIARIHQEMPEATLFFSTHILSDAEALCSSVALLKQGKLKVNCPIAQLIQNEPENYELTLTNVSPALQTELAAAHSLTASPLGFSFSLNGTAALQKEIGRLSAAGAKILSVYTKRGSLEKTLFSDSARETA